MPGQKAVVKEILLKNYKPIEVWKCDSIEEAIMKCKENSDKDVWVYLEIKTYRVLLQSEIKEMRRLKKDIVEIVPVFNDEEEELEIEDIREKTLEELFVDFYYHQKQVKPTEEMIELFLSIMNEGEEEDEAGTP